MNIVYLGTPEFSVEPLKQILEKTEHSVVAVVTNKDKPVGRKRIMTAPPVKVFAQSKGIKVFQYDKIRIEGVEDLKTLDVDLMITCAFGQILSKEILDIPKHGVFNIHASLLPSYRGASPIHYSILNGDKTTGITIMKTDVGVDTGDIIYQREIEVFESETCGELFNRLSYLGADCVIEVLHQLENGTITFKKQNNNLASYTKIFNKEDAKIDWNDTNDNIYNLIRAFNPAPVAYTILEGEPFKIFSATKCYLSGKAGQVISTDNGLIVACGKGALSLTKVQKSGSSAMSISDFMRGSRIKVGDLFGL